MTNQSKEEKINCILEELIGNGNFGIIDDHFSSDYVAHAGEKDYKGHKFLKQFSTQLRRAIPNIHVVGVKFLQHDKDKVTWQRTLSGTNKSALRGIPASGKKVTWVEMVVTQFQNERISEEWIVSELMGELLLLAPKK